MAAIDDAIREVDAMLDEGVHLDLEEAAPGTFVARIRVDEGCEDCLVPDEVLRGILGDALTRRGVPVDAIAVERT